MNDKIIIRNINESDYEIISELIKQLGYSSNVASVSGRLSKINGSKDYKTLGAEIGDKIVGFIGLCKMYAYEYDGEYVKVAALIVQEEYRGKGVGTKLIEAGEKWATEEGAIGINLNSGINRKETHEFYKSRGYVTKGYSFSKKLEKE